MTARYPGYDVLAKRHTLSWNEATRRVVDQRLAVHPGPRFFTAEEWPTLHAICGRILPQPRDRPPVPLPAYIDEKLFHGKIDGYRDAALPRQDEAWRIALAALDEHAREAHGKRFHELEDGEQDALLARMQKGELTGKAWQGMPVKKFFASGCCTTSPTPTTPTPLPGMRWASPARRRHAASSASMRTSTIRGKRQRPIPGRRQRRSSRTSG